IMIAFQVLRLHRHMPLVAGGVGGTQYVLIALLVVRPGLSEAMRSFTALAPGLLVIRGVVVALGGGAASLCAVPPRRAVGDAASRTRSRELFGKYRLEEEIAAGGMGIVYRATYCPEGGFERPVALKRIHPHLARDVSFVEAFRREAELCARLGHPNV